MFVKRSAAAIGGGLAGSLTRIAIQLLATLVIARMLGPTTYGVYAISSTVIAFAGFFSDFGVSYSLIQKPVVSKEDERLCLTWSVTLGFLVAIVVAALAPWLAGFFHNADAAPVIRILSVVLILQATMSVPANLLRRELRHKSLQGRHAIGYFIGYVLFGIPMAYLGAGIWALVTAWLVQATATLVLLFRARPCAARPLLGAPGAKDLWLSGALVFVTNLLNWVLVNIDRALVGRYFPIHSMGNYANAMNLSWQGATVGHSNLQSVFFAALRHAQGDTRRVWTSARSLYQIVLLLSLPAFAGLSAMAAPLIQTLFGQAWVDSVAVFRVLTLAMPAYLMLAIATPVLWTVGASRKEVLLQLPLLPLWLACAYVAADTKSLITVAWTVVALYVVRASVLLLAMTRAVGAKPGELVRSTVIGAACAAMVWSFVYFLDQGLASIQIPAAGRLVACVGGLTCAMVVLVRSARQLLDAAALRTLEQVICAIPSQTMQRLMLPKAQR